MSAIMQRTTNERAIGTMEPIQNVASPSLNHRSGHRNHDIQLAGAASRSNGESDQSTLGTQPKRVASPSQTNGSTATSRMPPIKKLPQSRNHREADQVPCDTQHHTVGSRSKRKARIGVTPKGPVPSAQSSELGDDGPLIRDPQFNSAASPSFDFSTFCQVYRTWLWCLRMQYLLDNRCRAFARQSLAWKSDLPEEERKTIKGTAKELIEHLRDHEDAPGDVDPEIISGINKVIGTSCVNHQMLEEQATAYRKWMLKQVKRLPIYHWACSIPGFGGKLALITVIGECGDIGNYSGPAKLWKRLGLAPFNGKAASTWRSKGGLTAKEWQDFGYKPDRRSRIYAAVGECLIKQNFSDKSHETDGKYRSIYAARKSKMAELHAGDKNYPPQRLHRDAQRIMEKELIKDLWVEWHKRPRST